MTEDIVQSLARIGIRASRESIFALLAHGTKSHLGPTEVIEQLVALELRERDARNLARRTRVAMLGTVPPLDAFD